MPRLRFRAALTVVFASAAGVLAALRPGVVRAEDAAPPGARPPGTTSAPAADVSDLVWRAVDAPEPAYPRALGDLIAAPGVTWRVVHDILRAGRDYAAIPRPAPPCTDAAAFGAYFDAFPWEMGKVRRYDLGADTQYWYSVELPADYDGTRAVPVWFDLGLWTEGAPPGFARVKLNDLIPGSISLGRAQSSMTAGFAVQSAILSVLADMERRFHCDRDRVFCGGFSRFGNATIYEGVHWPDLWAGIVPAAGYYEFDDGLLPNLRHVGVLAAHGTDRGHRAANDCTLRLAKRLAAAKHPDVTTHAADGRAIDGCSEPFLRWMGEPRRRTPLPSSVSYTLADPRHRGAYWIEITAVKATGTLRPVVIGVPGDTTAERFDVHTRAATVTAEVTAANAVAVRATNVAELRLRLSPAQFDLAKPVRIAAGGRTIEAVPEPSVATLLRNFRRDGDRSRLFPAEVTVRM